MRFCRRRNARVAAMRAAAPTPRQSQAAAPRSISVRPGGAATIALLAQALGRASLPLNPLNGREGPALVAQIDEARCIGCVKCLPPCPVDAIIGAKQHTHTVIAELCTGCELCVAPCPVDCIVMMPRGQLQQAVEAPQPALNRERFAAHTARLARRAAEQTALIVAKKYAASTP